MQKKSRVLNDLAFFVVVNLLPLIQDGLVKWNVDVNRLRGDS